MLLPAAALDDGPLHVQGCVVRFVPQHLDLREPLEVVLVVDVERDHLVDAVPLVHQEENDVAHDHSLDSCQREVDVLVLPVALSLVVQGPDDLVDPKLDSEEYSVERLLPEHLHDPVLRLGLLLVSLGRLRRGPGPCRRLGLLYLALLDIVLGLDDGFLEPVVWSEVVAEEVDEETPPALVRAQLQLWCSLEGLLGRRRGLLLALSVGRIPLSLASRCGRGGFGRLFAPCALLGGLAVLLPGLFREPVVIRAFIVVFATLRLLELLLPLPFLQNVVDLVREDQVQGSHDHLLGVVQHPLVEGPRGKGLDGVLHLLLHRLLHRSLDLDEPLLHVSGAGAADLVALDFLDAGVVILYLHRGLEEEELLVLRDHAQDLVLVDSLDAHLAVLDALLAGHHRLLVGGGLLVAAHQRILLGDVLVLDANPISREAAVALILLELDLVGGLDV